MTGWPVIWSITGPASGGRLWLRVCGVREPERQAGDGGSCDEECPKIHLLPPGWPICMGCLKVLERIAEFTHGQYE